MKHNTGVAGSHHEVMTLKIAPRLIQHTPDSLIELVDRVAPQL